MERTRWSAHSLKIDDEPLIWSLIKYRLRKDRHEVAGAPYQPGNLISSRVKGSRKQLPIIDLDFGHSYVESSTPGHGHLYLNEPISWWRWALLMLALRLSHAAETGFVVWSLRRGGNFVRIDTRKTDEEQPKSTYGWLFKLR